MPDNRTDDVDFASAATGMLIVIVTALAVACAGLVLAWGMSWVMG